MSEEREKAKGFLNSLVNNLWGEIVMENWLAVCFSVKAKSFELFRCYFTQGHSLKAEHRAEVIIKGTLQIA